MADFLIYNQTHWSKTVDSGKKSLWTTKEQAKFAAVSEIGDIVECFDTDKCGPHAHANGKMKIVRVKGFNPDKAQKMVLSLANYLENTMLHKRRYKLELPLKYKDKLDISLSYSEFMLYLKDKKI